MREKSLSGHAANLLTRTLDFGGFDSGRSFISRGGILMSVGNFPEMLSHHILVGVTVLVGRQSDRKSPSGYDSMCHFTGGGRPHAIRSVFRISCLFFAA